ncbi:YIP1 family protein [Cohnella cellulosilytica]|uniref:YIP1 family protein n=1 Tax=Cohnella cellulosilytica TaxID=986710 RepID=A0ABW2FJK9_9BACL
MKRWLVFLLLAAVAALAAPPEAHARLPYQTTYYDSNQSYWYGIQAIYKPEGAYGGQFDEPVDLFVGPDDKVYVADKGNDRVYVLGSDGSLLYEVGDEEGAGALGSPEGVFVTPEGDIYVADSGNQRIAVFGPDGRFDREYKKPDTSVLSNEHFVPTKVVVDRRGVMYVNTNASYQGLVRLDQEGEFMGYFGANKAQQSLLNWLKKLVLNKEQLAKEVAALPKPIANIAIDKDGFVYTATGGSFGASAIRKLNAGGVDAFKSKTFQHSHGIQDVAIDANGFLYNVDLDFGRVTLFDRTGDPLFAFGFTDVNTQQYGVFGFPTSIGVDGKFNVWVTDSRTKTVHKFTRTEFGADVLQALVLYDEGRYEESKPYWDRVYARNEMYNNLYQGLGKVYLEEKKNEQALDFMKEAFDTKGYSKAFWEIRLAWLQNHFAALLIGLVAFFLLLRAVPAAFRKLLARKPPTEAQRKTLDDLRNLGRVMIHPYDGFYRLKEAKVSPWLIIGILAAVVLVKVVAVYWTGFLIHPAELSQVNLWSALRLFALPWVTWIVANYLVCSVKDGEGKFREVIQGSTYALAPYLICSIPLIVLSNVITLEESAIFNAISMVMYLWMAVLFFVMTQVIHNFDFLESLKNIAVTVFAIGTIWLFGFIVFGLSYNLYDFFHQLYNEVIYYR